MNMNALGFPNSLHYLFKFRIENKQENNENKGQSITIWLTFYA